MEKNVGTIDKTIRIVVGIIIIGLGLYYRSWWGLIGIIPLVVAFVGFCPLYPPLHITTRKK